MHDVIIIGAGSAGLSALREVRKKTDNFVLINAGAYGTTCARVGCMPSKALIEASKAAHACRTHAEFGIRGTDNMQVDIAAVLQRVRRLRDHFVASTLQALDDLGERSIAGHARLLDAQQVEVNDRVLQARRIIIATGTHPVVPDAWRKLGDRLLTTDSLFEQATLPQRIAIIGLGAIGIEVAQALSRLGLDVTAFSHGDRLAGLSDPEINQTFRKILSQEFPIHTGEEVEIDATPDAMQVSFGNLKVEVDCVLAAIGRAPNLQGLGLETLSIELDEKGLPPFNVESMQIADLPIFMAGDVNRHAAILHEASDEGYIAGNNAVADEVSSYQRRTPLGIVFGDPDAAFVGLRFHELDIENTLIGKVSFDKQGRAITALHNYGRMHIYADKNSGRLLGAEMCVVAGEHMAHLLTLAIAQGLSVVDMLGIPFYHPVMEEGLRTALRSIADNLKEDAAELPKSNHL